MYVIPKSEVTIGDIKLYGVNSGINAVEINTSVNNLSNTAKLTIARNFAQRNGKSILDYIKTGARCVIKLGYNDKMRTEFIGYVTQIGDGTPLVINLEDVTYKFKHADKISNGWVGETTLQEILKHCFEGYTIDDRVNIVIGKNKDKDKDKDKDTGTGTGAGTGSGTGSDTGTGTDEDKTKNKGGSAYVINNATPYEVMKKLKDEFGFSTRIDEENKTILCFYAYRFDNVKTHTYVFGTRNEKHIAAIHSRGLAMNVAQNGLKLQRKEDTKMRITAIAVQKTGKPLTKIVGSEDKDAAKRTLHFGSEITSVEELEKRAQAEYDRLVYDGYTGSITGFGTPQTRAGDSLRIIDYENKSREGVYMIESVKITYSVTGGFKRENTLSYKIA